MVCGQAFIKYEHLDPEFNEATEHRVEGIVLLCGGCENKRTKGVLSVETIKRAAASPRAKQKGFSHETLDVGIAHPEIAVGSIVGRNCEVILRISNENVIAVLPPEVAGGPFRINASIKDRFGKEILKVEENEWQTPSDYWDIETIGRRILVRQSSGDIALVLLVDPPNRIVFERMDFAYLGTKVYVAPNQEFTVVSRGGTVIKSGGMECDNARIILDVGDNGDICVGRGGSLYVRTMVLNPGGRIGRNNPCFCGSAKRFKHCHGRHS